jgi:hypothetical protein
LPLTKQRSPEQWARVLEEVQGRSERRKQRQKIALLLQRDKLKSQRHKESRRLLVRKIKRLNETVKNGRFTIP